MKNGSNEVLEPILIERDERARKLYRYVSDVARRISELTTSSQSIPDLFTINIEVQRQKLRDNCEKLLFLHPVSYGKKSLELLWRKVYYETVSIAKKLRETDTSNDSYLYNHIECGIGNFHHFLDRIQLEVKVDFKAVDYVPVRENDDNPTVNVTTEEIQFYQSAVHSCLIYLGDLSRYQVEIFQSLEPSIAARYYLQAAHVDMTLGMPYNQLGNLYLDKNYNLDSVCYYIQCLSCTAPFEGAMGNLTKLFEKNTQFTEVINESDMLSQTEHIQSMLVNFLSLIEVWYLGKTDDNIPQKCNKVAQELKVCLDFDKAMLPDINKNYNEYVQAKEEEYVNPTYLNTNIVHKIIQICLFTVVKVDESDETKVFACKAFTLALFSILLQKLLKQLELLGLKNPANKYNPKSSTYTEYESKEEQNKGTSDTETPAVNGGKVSPDINLKEKVNQEPEKLLNGDGKNNAKKGTTKRRRRRRVASSESSDMSDDDTDSTDTSETDESGSEVEVSDSTYQSDNEQSDATDLEASDFDEVNDQDKVNNSNKENIVENGKITEHVTYASEEKDEINVLELQQFLQGDNFLPSIKLLMDWILLEKDLILSCGSSGESLFQCIVDLLNIFTYYFDSKSDYSDDDCKILTFARNITRKLKLEYKTIPLPEDINLRGTNICKFDKDATEWQCLNKFKISVYEENIIRILSFMEFGNQIVKIIPRIRFNRILKVFYLKKIQPPKLSTKINHKRSREWHNSKKPHAEIGEGGLLRRLGKLWLVSQVRELERSGQSAAPAFLALDTAALNKHLRKVKPLLRSRNFILLVPTIVLQELDDLKREQSTARDAIRWLEMQLKSGSRFLRAQRPGQTKPLPLLKYPRKAPQHILNYIQILEFCNHYIGDDKHFHGGNGDPDNWPQGKSAPLLSLLMGGDLGNEEEQYKEFSIRGAAQSAGICIEQIGNFYTKWKQTAQKNGKKR